MIDSADPSQIIPQGTNLMTEALKPGAKMSDKPDPANIYADVPFDRIRSERVGGFPRSDLQALRYSAKFLTERFEKARCDSEASSDCVRCNAFYLARLTTKALEGEQTVAEAANAYVSESRPKTPSSGEVEAVAEARDILSGLSSYLSAGIGDDKTTLTQYDDRIRWGIDNLARLMVVRCADVVEECSKRPATTWGQVRSRVLEVEPEALSSIRPGGDRYREARPSEWMIAKSALVAALHISPKLSCDDRIEILRVALLGEGGEGKTDG